MISSLHNLILLDIRNEFGLFPEIKQGQKGCRRTFTRHQEPFSIALNRTEVK